LLVWDVRSKVVAQDVSVVQMQILKLILLKRWCPESC
jgi:hypothetical protein